MSLKAGDRLNLKIDKIVHKGLGISKHNEMVIFVPFVCEGELVEVEITETKKNYANAELLKVITENKQQRIQPLCPVYEKCGGCDFQHLNYETQINSKKNILEQFFKKLKMPIPQIEIFKADNPFYYRNRIQLKHLGSDLGYFRHRSHEIVPIEKCFIASESINKKITDYKASQKKVIKEVLSVQFTENIESGTEDIEQDAGFSQVNNEMNLKLKEKVVFLLKQLSFENKSLIELYCGSGNFTIDLAGEFSGIKDFRLIAIEMDSRLATQLKNKMTAFDHKKNFQLYNMKAEHFFRRVSLMGSYNILLDPPRSGAGQLVMQEIANIKVKHLIYVSCEPSTLVRDLSYLNETKSFQINYIGLFDMFAQTHHMETVVALSFDS